MNREWMECLALAAVARECGDDRAALRFLDAANEFIHRDRAIDTSDIEIVSRERRGQGRPRLKRDPDSLALIGMDGIARGQGISSAETLARLVLKIPSYRRADRKQIGIGDVKRLAAKWKAKPKI